MSGITVADWIRQYAVFRYEYVTSKYGAVYGIQPCPCAACRKQRTPFTEKR